jgi:hypothetical protein
MTTSSTELNPDFSFAPRVLEDPDHPPVTAFQVTQKHAVRVAIEAARFLADDGEHPLLSQGAQLGDGPFVCPPGFHAGGWTVAYEGDYDWPWRLAGSLSHARKAAKAGEPTARQRALLDAVGDGFFLEPVTGWCLGIYEI